MSSQQDAGIRDFFTGRGVFITGATGFLGKVLLEKLLRSSPSCGNVYVLVRGKKDETPAQRINAVLSGELFDRLREEQPDFAAKVIPVIGDIMFPQLGLSHQDRDLIIKNVNVVLHCAATVSFNEKLRIALAMNVVAVQRLVALASSCHRIDAFVHVSTAYANCDRAEILDQVYPPVADPYKLIEATNWLDDAQLEGLTAGLLGKRPNTYTLTKSLGEYILCREGQHLPISIFRPSIVGAIAKDPLPGWTDNLNGPGGLYLACGKGVLRIMRGDEAAAADIVPVDFCASMILAIAWRTARLHERQPEHADEHLASSKGEHQRRGRRAARAKDANLRHNLLVHAPHSSEALFDIPSTFSESSVFASASSAPEPPAEPLKPTVSYVQVYHCTSGDKNPLYWAKNNEYVAGAFSRYPLEQVFRRPSFAHTNSSTQYAAWELISHTIPAYIADGASFLAGKRPRMRRIYYKLGKLMEAYNFFTSNHWRWEQTNTDALLAEMLPAERETYNFDMRTIDWRSYIEMYCIGIKKFILKEDMSRLWVARQQHQRMRAVRIACTLALLAFVLRVVFRFLRTRGFVKGSYTMLMNPFSFIMLSMKSQGMLMTGKSF
ncbi:male sterility protein [Capsaspora owczarzaki ATCC 30864]|uniref:Fatty acyl-CoA reductase n=1 Tax=Capsaspora owczarzaki (strain ATCC 30864) TaxID=595528 RepID=A0A0D2WLB4_CAPO3|nr:male sterility protein [Capsaspora owczarzaki ATCC 30864]KJE91335.1 male sterility protein [Capsaspora owczarzaki ATCC 30864]|eukprot:XP_004349237.1 male sterility protein [Capsaspora owczarzaki ATCC 30864]